MYTLESTDIDNGSEFFRKLNANFAEAANPQSSLTEEECRTRFVQEMNKKAVMLGMSNTSAHVIARVVGGILLDRDANVME